jgi:hypothetical protein
MRKYRHFTNRELALGRRASALAKGQEVLYHGTHHAIELLRSGRLIPFSPTVLTIPFTRSAYVAAYFALMEGGEIDGFSGAVLVLNKRTLSQSYGIEPFCEEGAAQDEQEEIIRNRIVNFRRHLIAVVPDDPISKRIGRQPVRFPFLKNSQKTTGRKPYRPLLADTIGERILHPAALERRGVFRKLEAARRGARALLPRGIQTCYISRPQIGIERE